MLPSGNRNYKPGGNPLEFWLTPAIEKEEGKVNLTVWHPLYAGGP